MTDFILKQFEMVRTKVLKEVESISDTTLDQQPKGFNNTIHWHVGHVLTVAEQFMFGKSFSLPANYKELFGNGSKPADWSGDVPTVAVLVEELKSQLNRIKEIPAAQFSETLEQPFLGCETFGELATFAMYHETNHIGQVHAMKLVIEK